MGVVVPDGILTNSSLQFVRDWIEEHFRLVAVISLPQTAFTHTGAGVKSSVLFVQKYGEGDIARIRVIKEDVQTAVLQKEGFADQIAALEAEKKRVIERGPAEVQALWDDLANHLQSLANQEASGEVDGATRRRLEKETTQKVKAYQKAEVYKAWKQAVSAEYDARLAEVLEALQEVFSEQVRKQLTDYPIFMAIAEDVGYDATGRETGGNELPAIAAELKRFIAAVRKGTDAFFGLAPV